MAVMFMTTNRAGRAGMRVLAALRVALVFGAAFAGMVALILGSAQDAPLANAAARTKGDFRSFPLARASVPVSSFAVLGEGIRGEVRWGVYAFRATVGKQARQHPCIVVATITRSGEYGSVPGCGALAPGGHVHRSPVGVLIGGTYSSEIGGEVSAITALAMTFDRSVSTIELEVEPGNALELQTSYLTVSQARKARLARFRFVAVSVARDVCEKHLRGLDAFGGLVLDADLKECPLLGRSS
jgi:hypothetical protein